MLELVTFQSKPFNVKFSLDWLTVQVLSIINKIPTGFDQNPTVDVEGYCWHLNHFNKIWYSSLLFQIVISLFRIAYSAENYLEILKKEVFSMVKLLSGKK